MQMKQQLESALQALPEGNGRVYEMRDLENQHGEKWLRRYEFCPPQ
jgi:hypothetical protein